MKIASLLPALTALTPLTVFAAPAGSLDTTFGAGAGFVIQAMSSTPPDSSPALTLQTDGKILLGGQADSQFGLRRLNEDGTPDSGFGTEGKAVGMLTDYFASPVQLVAREDGTIYGFGNGAVSSNGLLQFLIVARFLPTGALDTTFDSDGAVMTNVVSGKSDFCAGGLVQSDGKPVVAGSVSLTPGDWDFTMVRYTTTGALDTTFSGDGKAQFNLGQGSLGAGSSDSLLAIAQQSTGKFVLFGSYNNNYFGMIRVNTDGSLDTTFGTSGVVTGDIVSTAGTMAIQPDDKIVAVGSKGGVTPQFLVMRYNADGSLDTTFGTNGVVTTDCGNSYGYATGVAIDSAGRIIVAGLTSDMNNVRRVALLRYSSTGVLDTDFGTAGISTAGPGTGNESLAKVALDANGKIVAAGTAKGDSTFQEAYVARYKSVADPVAPVATNKAPTLKLTGSGKITTTAASLTLKGAASDDASVAKVLVNRKPAKGTKAWTYKAVLKVGINKFTITAVDSEGLVSKSVTVVVTRKKK